MTPPTTLQFFDTQSHEICVCCGNIRIHCRSVIGGVMTPPYNVLQIILPLNYNLNGGFGVKKDTPRVWGVSPINNSSRNIAGTGTTGNRGTERQGR
jgi:hypothetical protein